MTNTEQERERLARVYAAMSDGELEKIANEVADLTDVARQVLEAEVAHRGIVVEQVSVAVARREVAAALAVGPEGLVTIRQFRDLHDALLAQGTLQSAGIECFIADDNMVRLDWFISNLLGGVKLRVRQEEVEAALYILDQEIPEGFDVEGVGEYQQPRCPKCHSLDISFEEYHKGVALVSAAVVAPVPIRTEQWKCHSCGQEWHDEERSEE
jgi:hypothetical protein